MGSMILKCGYTSAYKIADERWGMLAVQNGTSLIGRFDKFVEETFQGCKALGCKVLAGKGFG